MNKLDDNWLRQHIHTFTQLSNRSIEKHYDYLHSIEIFILFHYHNYLYEPILSEDDYLFVKKLVNIEEKFSKPIKKVNLIEVEDELIELFETYKKNFGEYHVTANTHFLLHAARVVL